MSALAEHAPAHAARWTTFELEGESYGIDAGRVREWLAPCGVTAVPGLPPAVRGIKETGGMLLTVLDLRVLLGLPPRAPDTRSRSVVVESGALVVGLLVDGAGAAVDLDPAAVQVPPRGCDSPALRAVQGFVGDRDEVLVLLDVDVLTADLGPNRA